MSHRPLLILLLAFLLPAAVSGAIVDSLTLRYRALEPGISKVDSGNLWVRKLAGEDPEAALAMARTNLRLARELDYAYGESVALARVGFAHDYFPRLDSARWYYLQAGDRHAQAHEFGEASDNYHNVGLTYYLGTQYEAAIRWYDKAEVYADSAGGGMRMSRILNNKGKVFQQLALFDMAEKAFVQSLAIRRTLEDPSSLLYSLENLFNLHLTLNQHASAAPYLNEAIEIVEALGDSSWLPSLLTKKGRLLVAEGQFREAIEVLEQAVDLGEASPYYTFQVEVPVYWTGVAWFRMGQSEKAVEQGLKALAIATREGRKSSFLNIRELLADAYIALGKPGEAVPHLQALIELEDEIMNDKVMDMMAEQAVRYRLDSIRNAEAAQTALARAEQETQRRIAQEQLRRVDVVQQRNAYLVTLALVLGLGALLLGYFLLANRRANAKIKEQKALLEASLEEKEVLMREIHHRVKNNLQSIASMLQVQRRRSDNAVTQETLGKTLLRVSTLSRLHSILYQQKDLSTVNAEEYLGDLIQKILLAFDASARTEMALGELNLDQDQLLYLGFILNEWLTNALKYSDQKDQLEISIRTEKGEGEAPRIGFRENGHGYQPEAIQQGFGLSMMHNLAHRMGGKMVYEPSTNTTWIHLHAASKLDGAL